MERRNAVARIGSVILLGIVPVLAVLFMFRVGWHTDSLAIDFHNEIYPEAKLLLHGTSPFPELDADLSRGSNFIWPPFAGYVVAPLTLLPAGGADIVAAALSLTAFVAALWIVGVRDWRVYGVSLLWPPVIGEVRTAHLTLVLCLLLAVAWRTRDRFPLPGLALGVALGLKFFLWPPVIGEVRTAHLTLVLCLLLAVAWRTRDRFPLPGLALGVALGLKFFLWPLVIWLAALRRWRDAVFEAGLASPRVSMQRLNSRPVGVHSDDGVMIGLILNARELTQGPTEFRPGLDVRRVAHLYGLGDPAHVAPRTRPRHRKQVTSAPRLDTVTGTTT